MPRTSIKQLLDGAPHDLDRFVRKVFEIKSDGATLEDNRLRGAAAVMGNLDRGSWIRDVIYPGAFSGKGVLKDFVANGFVATGHKWRELPIAMPMSAEEVGNELQCEAMFHSTQAAQDARTVAKERLANGKSVGLSVGFGVDYEDGAHIFQNGKDLLTHAEGMGCDMDLFDRKAISAHKDYCRGISQVDELYEFSVVTVPMNPRATASDVKGFAEDDDDEEGGRVTRISVPDLTTFRGVRDYERFLCDAGFTLNGARRLIRGFKDLQWDAGVSTDPTPPTSDPAPPAAEQVDAATREAREHRFRQLQRRMELLRSA